jgi:hypothetical protein
MNWGSQRLTKQWETSRYDRLLILNGHTTISTVSIAHYLHHLLYLHHHHHLLLHYYLYLRHHPLPHHQPSTTLTTTITITTHKTTLSLPSPLPLL